MRYPLHILLALLLCALFFPGSTNAQTLVQNANVNFGTVDFDGSHSTWMYLGTDGNITTTGSGIVSYNDGHAGSVTITAPAIGIVEVKCNKNARLNGPNATQLLMSQHEVALNTGVPFGSGASCDGTGNSKAASLVIDLGATPSPTILLGARLKLRNDSTIAESGEYTSIGTGTKFRIRVLFQ